MHLQPQGQDRSPPRPFSPTTRSHVSVNPKWQDHSPPAPPPCNRRESSGESSSYSSPRSLHFEWRIAPARLKIHRRPDGSDWRIGYGGFGAVYLGLLDGVHEVAVKVMITHTGAPPSPAQQQQFEAEIAIMRAARHRNVVAFVGAHMAQVSDQSLLCIPGLANIQHTLMMVCMIRLISCRRVMAIWIMTCIIHHRWGIHCPVKSHFYPSFEQCGGLILTQQSFRCCVVACETNDSSSRWPLKRACKLFRAQAMKERST